MVSDSAIRRFQAIVASDSVRAAIIYLNSLTPHRFTSMMLLADDISRSLVFVDCLYTRRPLPRGWIKSFHFQ